MSGRIFIAGLLVAAAFAALAPGAGSAARTAAKTQVPPAAVSAVSAALGADDAAYHLRGAVMRNRRNGISARFGRDGASVRVGGTERAVQLVSIGTGADVAPVARAGRPDVLRNRAVYPHRGVTEWYANGPAGLDHGFTVPARPATAPGALTLLLRASGGPVRLDADARGLRFAGTDLAYRGLWAVDARGRDLPARLERRGGDRVALRVDDRGARYPVTIDPFFEAASLTASDAQPNARLGLAVAMSGNTIVAGSGSRAVYVFEKPAAGWANATQTAKLTTTDNGPFDSVGASVAIDGTTIVAGNPEAGDGGESARLGNLYVWERPAGGWRNATQTARLQASAQSQFAELGRSVAISGTTIAAGAPGFSPGVLEQQGGVYVFQRPAGGWPAIATQRAILLASDPVFLGRLGASVAIDGGLIAAGAPGRGGNLGAVYTFRRPGTDWVNGTQQDTLTSNDGVAGDALGGAVALDGTTVAAGVPNDDNGRGAVYVWENPAAGVHSQKGKLTAAVPADSDHLGSSVALEGDTLVATAPGATVGTTRKGAAYVFRRPAPGWQNLTEAAKVPNAGAAGAEGFGPVGLGAGTFAVGASGANGDRGRVSVWVEDATLPDAPLITATDPPSPAPGATPRVRGTAEPGSTVRVFPNGNCSGAAAATGTAAAFAAPGLQVTVPGNATTALSAIATDVAGNASPCGVAGFVYQSDSIAPTSPGIAGPPAVVAGTAEGYAVNVSDAGSGIDATAIRWTVDEGLPAQTGSTVTFTFPTPGTYTLRANATDRAGNRAPEATLVVTAAAPALPPAVSPVTLPPAPLGPATPPPPARITTPIPNSWVSTKTYTTMESLAVSDVPAGATVEVRCSGPRHASTKRVKYGCPYAKKVFKPTGKVRQVELRKAFAKRRLPLKTTVEIRVTAPGALGKVLRFTMVRRALPRQEPLCLFVGASKPTFC